MMIQHLSEKLDDLDRCDPFLVESEQEVASTTDSRHGRNTSTFASDLNLRCLPAEAPSLAEESCERDVSFVLEVQNSPVFQHCAADPGNFPSSPNVTRVLVKLVVLPLGLLVSEPCFPQSPPYCIARDADAVLILDDRLHARDCPEVSLVSKVRG